MVPAVIISPTRLALALGATALAWRERKQIILAAVVAKYSFMVFLVDRLPAQLRRAILANEYTGEALEKRLTQRIFKGVSTVRALYRMSSVNLRPRVNVGDVAPETPVLHLHDASQTTLNALAHGARPLVLNFGSCT